MIVSNKSAREAFLPERFSVQVIGGIRVVFGHLSPQATHPNEIEGGNGGKRGHSNPPEDGFAVASMTHWDDSEDLKRVAKGRFGRATKDQSRSATAAQLLD